MLSCLEHSYLLTSHPRAIVTEHELWDVYPSANTQPTPCSEMGGCGLWDTLIMAVSRAWQPSVLLLLLVVQKEGMRMRDTWRSFMRAHLQLPQHGPGRYRGTVCAVTSVTYHCRIFCLRQGEDVETLFTSFGGWDWVVTWMIHYRRGPSVFVYFFGSWTLWLVGGIWKSGFWGGRSGLGRLLLFLLCWLWLAAAGKKVVGPACKTVSAFQPNFFFGWRGFWRFMQDGYCLYRAGNSLSINCQSLYFRAA